MVNPIIIRLSIFHRYSEGFRDSFSSSSPVPYLQRSDRLAVRDAAQLLSPPQVPVLTAHHSVGKERSTRHTRRHTPRSPSSSSKKPTRHPKSPPRKRGPYLNENQRERWLSNSPDVEAYTQDWFKCARCHGVFKADVRGKAKYQFWSAMKKHMATVNCRGLYLRIHEEVGN
ncbi:hypothetical protein BDN70DRAFT_959339 [Pholiota conissans]|uniref:Uncharacterized protein n=1 Tax=Pholiota conissans TaxID=109636 RepID=A0A9P6CQ81_9AGAR|nr:hypothetical protein BDN70DRAFT_959339 [Pholiota conissans]